MDSQRDHFEALAAIEKGIRWAVNNTGEVVRPDVKAATFTLMASAVLRDLEDAGFRIIRVEHP